MCLLDISIQYRVVIGISAMVLLFTGFLVAFISNQRKKLQYHKDLQAMQEEQKKALTAQNLLLEQRVLERTEELSMQKDNLQKALTDLKMSQLQLIQKEKMASLGELTAGVAHEIQNPLNFVLNFSAINNDLINELKDRLHAGNVPLQVQNETYPILNDLDSNLSKIVQYGNRADGIVKSMLQHSRKHSGEPELTDINALISEYLNLSFYGFKTKHKNFQCGIETHLQEDIEKIEVVPQDIGSMLMNIFNNSFYSVLQKTKTSQDGYQPLISASTQKSNNRLLITLRDNGVGIPEKYINKIFNPFFTTKPTGEGTGLGLSLCYDIVKAHQGSISVQSTQGEFAEFVIEL